MKILIKSIKSFFNFWLEIIRNRYLIWQLTKRDFKSQYVDSYLGLFWAFFHPLVFFSVLYMVFTMGFRTAPNNDGMPFIAYLITGMSAWFFFSGLFSSGANVIKAYSFLVRRSGFKLFVLPVVKAISGWFIHLFFMSVVFIIVYATEVRPHWTLIQLPYYMLATMIFMIGLSWFTSSISVFVPDINKLIPILIQIGFWGTPIFWDINRFPEKFQYILKLNPAFYIVNGYRDSFLYQKWFWEHPALTAYFWALTFSFMFIGALTYKRLKPHFAEVL